jgi:hypothetical protein
MSTFAVNISWQDRLYQTSSNSFEVNDAASALTLATNLKNFVRCGIKGITITEKMLPSEIGATLMTPNATEEFGTVDQKAVLSFLDDAGNSHTWELPAPQDGLFEEVPRLGKRVTADYGAQIATVLSNELGISLTFQEGWFKSDK